MFYAKHPTLGNQHFESVDRAAMEADGWVFWPHGSGLPAYLESGATQLVQVAESQAPAPEAGDVGVTSDPAQVVPDKRKPGRPKKSA